MSEGDFVCLSNWYKMTAPKYLWMRRGRVGGRSSWYLLGSKIGLVWWIWFDLVDLVRFGGFGLVWWIWFGLVEWAN